MTWKPLTNPKLSDENFSSKLEADELFDLIIFVRTFRDQCSASSDGNVEMPANAPAQ
ncbi:hypothetical protein [Paraburkholderia sp. RL17-347-BIC-D]|uniref:hypothetical protein n=1 Tax=Paraburkholderia sp. RL17-347-BIC-D TaxID=3031632 RepID=UPI0038BBB474